MKKVIPIIICGGTGTRLWPISSKNTPKQFIKFFENKTLFDMSLERAMTLSDETPIIVASKKK